MLTANQISELADLEPLASLPKLTHLVLKENPVARKEVRRATSSTTRNNFKIANMVLRRTTDTGSFGDFPQYASSTFSAFVMQSERRHKSSSALYQNHRPLHLRYVAFKRQSNSRSREYVLRSRNLRRFFLSSLERLTFLTLAFQAERSRRNRIE